MKVAYVTMRFPALSETFAGTDLRMLKESGVDVSVYAMRRPVSGWTALLAERGLSELVVSHGTFAADCRGAVAALRHPILLLGLLAWVVRSAWAQPAQLLVSLLLVPRSLGIFAELRRQRPDVVHLFWGHYPSLVGFLVLRAMPGTVLSMFLGAYDLLRGYGGSRFVAQRAHVITTHVRCNLETLERLGVSSTQVRVVYRGIDPALFPRCEAARVSRRLVAAGRLDADKGIDDVLRVFHNVHARWPDATLHILGDGPERQRLERLRRQLGLERSVAFLGHLPQRQVAAELAAAEVFLFLSREATERLPNVIKEAMATGCICVVGATPGIEELLQDGEHGFVVPPGDLAGAISCIEKIFRGFVDRSAMSAAARARVIEHFDARKAMSAYRAHWEAALVGLRRHASAGVETRQQAASTGTSRI